MIRRVVTVLTVAGWTLLSTASPAHAHGIGGRLDLPVPLSYFIVGAALVLVVTFAALAVLWPEPRMQDGPHNRVVTRGAVAPRVLMVLGLLGLVLVVGPAVVDLIGLGRVPARPTAGPVVVWVVFWLVVPFAGALVGNWYRDLNPWRGLARLLRLGHQERPATMDGVGIWPAALLLLAFTWLELVSPNSGSPETLGLVAIGYTALLVGVMALVGRETGLAVADAFTPYNRLISSISPFDRDSAGRLISRGWLRALPSLPEWRGLVAFVVVAIGTVSYDGLSGTAWFGAVFGSFGSSVGGGTLLLLASVVVMGGLYLSASWVAARMAGRGTISVARRFAHTLVPIALAYAVAHYLTLIIFEGQQLIAAASDPFGLGWNLFGTAERRVDFFITTSEPIWYAQVAVIVAGHVLAVVLAHDRALADFGSGAVRSQYAMLVLMVALTTLGLIILAG